MVILGILVASICLSLLFPKKKRAVSPISE
jgi:hypothetical protein